MHEALKCGIGKSHLPSSFPERKIRNVVAAEFFAGSHKLFFHMFSILKVFMKDTDLSFLNIIHCHQSVSPEKFVETELHG